MNEKNDKSEAALAIQKIREAEEEAQKIVLDAHEQVSLKIIPDAYTDAKKIKEHHLLEAKKRAKKNRNLIIQKAKKEAETIKSRTKQEVAVQKEKAGKNLQNAVEKTTAKLKRYLERGAF